MTDTTNDELLLPAPPPPAPLPKKGPGKGLLLSIVLFLLLTLPLSVKLIADQRQLADLRKQAMEALDAGGGGGYCGDGYCAPGENCPADCEVSEYSPCPPGQVPGASGCEPASPKPAPQQPQQSGGRCGDNRCDPGENCSADCEVSEYSPCPPGQVPGASGCEPAPPAPQTGGGCVQYYGEQCGCPNGYTGQYDCQGNCANCVLPPPQPADACVCNEERNQWEGRGCDKFGQTCGIDIVDRRPTSYCKASVIKFCEINYARCIPDTNGGSCGDFQPPPTAPKTSPSAIAKSGYCDRSSPNTDGCTDKNEGASCSIRDGGSGTCRIIVSGGANTECACVASGPPPPATGARPPEGERVPPPVGGPPQAAGPQCANLKIYKGGQVVTPSTLRAGDQVQLAIAGTGATKGRVRVNGGSWIETTTKNSAGEFIVDFTIPAATTNFSVEGEILVNGTWL